MASDWTANVGGQLLRAGTAVGTNYEEGRGGESRADFIHKLAVAWKEIRESRFWLRVIHRAELVSPPASNPCCRKPTSCVPSCRNRSKPPNETREENEK